jgi:hypothetical protein
VAYWSRSSFRLHQERRLGHAAVSVGSRKPGVFEIREMEVEIFDCVRINSAVLADALDAVADIGFRLLAGKEQGRTALDYAA